MEETKPTEEQAPMAEPVKAEPEVETKPAEPVKAPEVKKAETEKKPEPSKKKDSTTLAVIQIRGTVAVSRVIKSTLIMLNLKKKHNCVLVPATPEILGMLQKGKDFITWGPITPETIKLLEKVNQRGKAYFMPPPKGGFERGGIKKSFAAGGVLGDRGDKINDLIKRMIS
jgi:large subunit ribosomal protein L30